MTEYSYKTNIKAPFDRIWTHCVDKIENPGKYLPVTDVKILSRAGPQELTREMKHPALGTVVEVIRWSAKEGEHGIIYFDTQGVDRVVVNELTKVGEGEFELEYYTTTRDGKRSEAIEASKFEPAVLKTKEAAEAGADH